MPKHDMTILPELDRPDDDGATWRLLQSCGAVLLRGAAGTAEAFEALTDRFAERYRIHQDPSRPRYNAADTLQGVAGGADAIALHAERAYLPGRPELLFFCCLTPAAAGGATTVCDGAALRDALTPEDQRMLADLSLVWRTTMDPPMWQRMWHTESADEATERMAAALAAQGDSARARHWFDGDTLHVEYRASAVETGWIGGRRAFANYLLLQAEASEGGGPQARQADGAAIPADWLRRVAAAADALTLDIPWTRGDVVLIDNTRCMHGRRAFAGGERRILVRMGDARAAWRAGHDGAREPSPSTIPAGPASGRRIEPPALMP